LTKQLICFLGKHNILNKHEFGFRKNKSTEDAVSTIIENIIENQNNKMQFCTVRLIKST
jgi:retron-type reverse transcriptase